MRFGWKPAATASLGVLALVALGGADAPATLPSPPGGLWEVGGLPNSRPVRLCVRNPQSLARFEHRRDNCSDTLVRSSGDRKVVEYRCSSGGFGRSEVTVLTPRSLRIETQGISGGLPFRYVLQARRVGGCAY